MIKNIRNANRSCGCFLRPAPPLSITMPFTCAKYAIYAC